MIQKIKHVSKDFKYKNVKECVQVPKNFFEEKSSKVYYYENFI